MLALNHHSVPTPAPRRHTSPLSPQPRFAAFHAPVARFRTPLVLIVEGGESSADPSLAELLDEGNCDVRTAATGDEAFLQLECLRPDVVLVEATLSGSPDGYEVCRRITSDGRWRHLPVLLADSNLEANGRARGFAAGAADTLARSASPAELLASVAAHARTGSTLRSLEAQNAALQHELSQRREHDQHLRHTLDRAVISGRNHRVQFSTDKAQRLLRRFFPDHRTADALPPALAAWLAEGAHAPWQENRDGCQLTVTLSGSADAATSGRPFLLTLDESFPASTGEKGPASLAPLGLTRREAEVLYWIAHGKTNPETGIILRIAPNTIKKHMQNIMLKLGVENRLAAASRALEVIGIS